jgi:hypothetical protein
VAACTTALFSVWQALGSTLQRFAAVATIIFLLSPVVPRNRERCNFRRFPADQRLHCSIAAPLEQTRSSPFSIEIQLIGENHRAGGGRPWPISGYQESDGIIGSDLHPRN